MPETTLTTIGVALFGAWTLITILGNVVTAVIASKNTRVMGEKVQIDAVAAVTDMVKDAVIDARTTRDELSKYKERSARLEGMVEGVMKQSLEDRKTAKKSSETITRQGVHIEELEKKVKSLNDEIKLIRQQLAQVEHEKATLEEEKKSLEETLDTRSEEYKALMHSVQQRIDKAVADVREELTEHYEARIAELNEEIQQRNEEIARLNQLLKEKSHETQPQQIPNPATSSDSIPTPKPFVAGSTGHDPGSNPGSDPHSLSSGDATRSSGLSSL